MGIDTPETGRRIVVDEDTELDLEFILNEQTIRCRVLDLGEHGVRAVYPASAPELRAGLWLASLTLRGGDGPPVGLRVLTLEDISVHDDGRSVIHLAATDEQSRAGLWTVMDRLRAGHLGPEAGNEAQRRRIRPVPQRGVYTEAARLERLAHVRRQTGRELRSLEHTFLRPERLTGNIENLIGSVELPVGVAGPLLFRGERTRGIVYAPMATTEGALVASVTRGAIAITRAGGVTTRVLRQQMMRVPLFIFADMRGAYRFSNWVRDHLDDIRDQTRRVSSHARLRSASPELRGNMVTVSFVYETGDAAGQNMSTSCTWQACQWMIRQMRYLEDIHLERFFIESGVSGDKKVSYQSFISGRGTRVTAECLLPAAVVEDVLKVTPSALAQGYELASAFGVQAGTIGWNINVANVIAAMFAATGQDIACVHESSVALLYLREAHEGVYASLVLPSLVVGTVGGGTHLPRQVELLEMLDCAGPDRLFRFAEIIAGFCLALDLSTLAAIAGGQFAAAHERLGRNRPVAWFTGADLVPSFFESGVRRALGDPSVMVETVTVEEPADLHGSIITELTAGRIEKLIGLIPVRLGLRSTGARERSELRTMVKVKPLDAEVILMTHRLAAMCGTRLADSHARFKDQLGLKGSHVRELAVYEQTDERFRANTPVVYGTFRDDVREAYVVVLEDLTGFETIDPARHAVEQDRELLVAAITGLAEIHAVWYGREEELVHLPWIGHVMSTTTMTAMSELWNDLGAHAAREFPEWFSSSDRALHHRLVETIPEWWPSLEAAPRTLIHNDFNTRNLAFRRTPAGVRLAAYDWELATVGLPQHDLAELMCYVLPPDVSRAEVDEWLDLHRRVLSETAGVSLRADVWREGFRACVFDLAVNRFALTLAAHTFRHYSFMERVVATQRRLIELYDGP